MTLATSHGSAYRPNALPPRRRTGRRSRRRRRRWGEALLRATVEYVKRRTQFGVAIGSFQAVKHRLADTLTGLEFARPLLYGAALALAEETPRAGADVAAAKVTAGEAAHAAARAALQLHGAVGYTDELDLSLWLRKARPLRDAWGAPGACRERVVAGD